MLSILKFFKIVLEEFASGQRTRGQAVWAFLGPTVVLFPNQQAAQPRYYAGDLALDIPILPFPFRTRPTSGAEKL